MKKDDKVFHYYDKHNVAHEVIISVDNLTPIPDNYIRGRKPSRPETKLKRQNNMKLLFSGKEKPLEQRQKMRDRKLNIPKTPEHKVNMSKGQKNYWDIVHKIHEQNPDLTIKEVVRYYREYKKDKSLTMEQYKEKLYANK